MCVCARACVCVRVCVGMWVGVGGWVCLCMCVGVHPSMYKYVSVHNDSPISHTMHS